MGMNGERAVSHSQAENMYGHGHGGKSQPCRRAHLCFEASEISGFGAVGGTWWTVDNVESATYHAFRLAIVNRRSSFRTMWPGDVCVAREAARAIA